MVNIWLKAENNHYCTVIYSTHHHHRRRRHHTTRQKSPLMTRASCSLNLLKHFTWRTFSDPHCSQVRCLILCCQSTLGKPLGNEVINTNQMLKYIDIKNMLITVYKSD
jgi:hypothetical protein